MPGARSRPWQNDPEVCSVGEKHPERGTSNGVEFRCMDGWCLKFRARCNGLLECMDGSDEQGCADKEGAIPARGPAAIRFTDTDPKPGWLAGPVTVSSTHAADTDYYHVFAQLPGGKYQELTKIMDSGADELTADVALPANTQNLVVVAGNDIGETDLQTGSARTSVADVSTTGVEEKWVMGQMISGMTSTAGATILCVTLGLAFGAVVINRVRARSVTDLEQEPLVSDTEA